MTDDPFVCDVCGRRIASGGWLFTTPATETYHPEDPRWVVCGQCRPFVLARDLDGCMARWQQHAGIKAVLTITPDNRLIPDPSFDHDALRDEVREIITALLEHQDGTEFQIA